MKKKLSLVCVVMIICILASNIVYAQCDHKNQPQGTACDNSIDYGIPCSAIPGCTGKTIYCRDFILCLTCGELAGVYATSHLCADVGHEMYLTICPIGNYSYCPY